jgi:hypothetical protein
MQVVTNYGRELSRFSGMVRIIMASERAAIDVPATAVTIIEGSNVIVDDGVHPRRLLLQVASIEELPEESNGHRPG